MTQDQPRLSTAALRQFTGTEKWYRHNFVRSVLYTEGVQYVAEKGGTYWLLDEIACAQIGDTCIAKEGFQLWKLEVRADQSAILTCENGNGHVVFTKGIAYTDFPLDAITFYFTDNVILLPSEY